MKKLLVVFVRCSSFLVHVPDYQRANQWSHEAIGVAIEVHRLKGPGLLETIYERCLLRELFLRKVPCLSQLVVPIEYKGFTFEEPLRLDVYVDKCLIVEAKPWKPFCRSTKLNC